MIHEEFIQQLRTANYDGCGLQAMLLVGSCGRGVYSAHSDIDLQVLVKKGFDKDNLIDIMKSIFKEYDIVVHSCSLRNKISLYSLDYPKIDIGIFHSLHDINRNFIGSELQDLDRCILFINQQDQESIYSHLQQLIENAAPRISQKEIDDLIDRFVCEYESASSMHRRSDAYQFYFFYNIALQCVVQLACIARGEYHFNFLPKRFMTHCNRIEQQDFSQLAGSLYLSEGNRLKRSLLNSFYTIVEKLSITRLESIRTICEMIYRRDYFWNFRDASRNIPTLKQGCLYRSSALCLVPEVDKAIALLEQYQINTIIDLRAVRKNEEGGQSGLFRQEEAGEYDPQLLKGRNYILADLDPWEQPESFKQSEHHIGSNAEIAYRFFVLGCKPQIKLIMETIINSTSPVLIHCFAGKDRTGIVMAMLALLSGASIDEGTFDYLASEQDTNKEKIDIVFDLINQQGGIESYLNSCGLEHQQILTLKTKISNG